MRGLRRELTQVCPDCGARFLSATLCRGVHPNFHPKPVQTLPLYSCERPPLRHYRIIIEGFAVNAEGQTQARELARHTVQELLGGDTKLAAKMVARLNPCIGVAEEIDERDLDQLAGALDGVRDELLHGSVVVGVPSRRQLEREPLWPGYSTRALSDAA
jgi:hypothetical protein